MFGKENKPKTDLQRKLERLRMIAGLPADNTEEDKSRQEYIEKYSTAVIMPNPATLVSCVEEVAAIEGAEGIDPIALDNMIVGIRKALGPAVQASDKDGLYVENEKYAVTLMKSGLIKIIEKIEI